MAKVIKREYIHPQANKQTYFTTPAKDNTTNYSGVIGEIGTNDFMIEFVGNFENASAGVFNPLVCMGLSGFGYGERSINIYGIDGKNSADRVLYEGPIGSELTPANSIYINKTFPQSKLIHIVIGRSGTSAWAYVNGIKYSTTHDRVLEISNQLTISNAKKFALFRKFNFADEDYAKKLYNVGRWWDVVVEEVYMREEIKSLVPSNPQEFINGTLVDGIYNLNAPFKEIYRPVDGQKTSNYFILKCKYFTSKTGIYFRGAFRGSHDKFIEITEINKWNEVTLNFTNNYNSDMVYLAFSDGLGRPLIDEDATNIYQIKDIEFYSLSCTDEFLPQSFKDTIAINTATPGRNLIANNPTKITHNYDVYEQEVISATTAPTDAPGMEGQTWINTTNNTTYIAKNTQAISDWLPIN